MLSEKLEKELNAQINAEVFSAYLYFAKASWFKSQNLEGCAGWMQVQALEELTHAKKFYDFVEDRGGRVVLAAIDAPPREWDSPLQAFEKVLEHERKVTGLINGLLDLAREERDHATEIFLQWFVTEQVEEEAAADKIIQQLKLMGAAPGGLYMLDKELGARNASTLLDQFQNQA